MSKKPNVTLEQFLKGETLHYTGFNRRKTEATYIAGIGITVEQRNGKDIVTADVVDDLGATRVYHNMTREFKQEDTE